MPISSYVDETLYKEFQEKFNRNAFFKKFWQAGLLLSVSFFVLALASHGTLILFGSACAFSFALMGCFYWNFKEEQKLNELVDMVFTSLKTDKHISNPAKMKFHLKNLARSELSSFHAFDFVVSMLACFISLGWQYLMVGLIAVAIPFLRKGIALAWNTIRPGQHRYQQLAPSEEVIPQQANFKDAIISNLWNVLYLFLALSCVALLVYFGATFNAEEPYRLVLGVGIILSIFESAFSWVKTYIQKQKAEKYLDEADASELEEYGLGESEELDQPLDSKEAQPNIVVRSAAAVAPIILEKYFVAKNEYRSWQAKLTLISLAKYASLYGLLLLSANFIFGISSSSSLMTFVAGLEICGCLTAYFITHYFEQRMLNQVANQIVTQAHREKSASESEKSAQEMLVINLVKTQMYPVSPVLIAFLGCVLILGLGGIGWEGDAAHIVIGIIAIVTPLISKGINVCVNYYNNWKRSVEQAAQAPGEARPLLQVNPSSGPSEEKEPESRPQERPSSDALTDFLFSKVWMIGYVFAVTMSFIVVHWIGGMCPSDPAHLVMLFGLTASAFVLARNYVQEFYQAQGAERLLNGLGNADDLKELNFVQKAGIQLQIVSLPAPLAATVEANIVVDAPTR